MHKVGDVVYQSIRAVAKAYDINPNTLFNRINAQGLDLETAVTKPVKVLRRREATPEPESMPIGVGKAVAKFVPIDAFDNNKKDNINPSHYTYGKHQCIDVLEDILKDCKGIDAFCLGNAIKYLWRCNHKNGVEDLKKARWYLNRLIDNIDKVCKENE